MDNLFQKSNRMPRLTFRFPLLPGTCLAALLALLSTSLGTAQEARLFIASTVYTMEGEPLRPGQVLVVDGKIKAVGEKVDVGDSAPEIIDLGEGSALMPGLVDAASVTPLVDGGSDEFTREVTPDFRVIDSIDWELPALQRQLRAGTTTMCVTPGTENVFGGVAAVIKTAPSDNAIVNDDFGLVAMACNDPTRRNQSRSRPDSIYVRQPTNRMGVVWILRKTFDQAARSEGEGTDDLSPVRESLQGARPLMMVSRLSHDLTTVATIASEFDLQPIIVGGQEAYKVKEMLAEKKFPVILQRLSVGSIRGDEGSEVCWNVAGVLQEAGVPYCLSGDDLLEQARFARRHGLAGDDALAAITSAPARILKLDDRVGSISAGKDADLIALDGDPLDFTTSVRWVMVNGNIIDE